MSYEIINTGLARNQKPYKAKITVNFTPSNATNKSVTWYIPGGVYQAIAIESSTSTSCVIYTSYDLSSAAGQSNRITATAADGPSASLIVRTYSYSYKDDGDSVKAGCINSIGVN